MDETPRSTLLRGVPDRPFDGRAACGLLRATRPPNRLPFCPHRSPACGAPCPQRARAFDSSLDLREGGALDVSRAHLFPPRARSDSPTSPACGSPCRKCFKQPRRYRFASDPSCPHTDSPTSFDGAGQASSSPSSFGADSTPSSGGGGQTPAAAYSPSQAAYEPSAPPPDEKEPKKEG